MKIYRKFNITVGIPVYNEEKTIARNVNSVLRQIKDKDEIIVVASGCTDNTVSEIKKTQKKDRRVNLIIEKERKGKASAINLIIKNAKYDIIVQTDGDLIVGKGVINHLLRHFKDKKVGAVSGYPIPIIPEDNFFYDWTLMSYRKIHELRKKESEKGNFWHLSGYLLAFRKKALSEVPFAKGAVDAWMGKIIKENGYKIVYEPEAKVLVKAPLTIKDFIRQKARVRAGYYFFPKMPRTIKKEIFYFPKELLKIPFKRWPKFFISATIYFYSWMRGFYFAKTNKSLHEIWKIPKSTK